MGVQDFGSGADRDASAEFFCCGGGFFEGGRHVASALPVFFCSCGRLGALIALWRREAFDFAGNASERDNLSTYALGYDPSWRPLDFLLVLNVQVGSVNGFTASMFVLGEDWAWL